MNKKRLMILFFVLILIVVAILILEKQNPILSGNVVKKEVAVTTNSSIISFKEANYPKAIELVSPDGYINTDNITISQFIGKKVILLDFWDYSCINCQRTIPYLNAWYQKYKDQGLVIIGIHTPEFEFEKNYTNVKMATEKYNITYPVVLDNEYQTWQAYGNQYWPREYLIDIDGFIVHDNIGEGGYAETENAIQKTLLERAQRLGINETINTSFSQPNIETTNFQGIQTPEIYFGYGFSRGQIGNAEGYNPGNIVNYTIPQIYKKNEFYLGGSWLNNNDNMESADNSAILLDYNSKNVNIVAGSNNQIQISVYIDGNFVQNLTVSNYGLYTIYSGKNYSEHLITIKTPAGLKMYTFTFG